MGVRLPLTEGPNLDPRLEAGVVTSRDADYTSRPMVVEPEGTFRAKFKGDSDLPLMIAEVVAAVSEGFCLLCREPLEHSESKLRCLCCGFVFRLLLVGGETEFELDWPEPRHRCAHYQALVAGEPSNQSQG